MCNGSESDPGDHSHMHNEGEGERDTERYRHSSQRKESDLDLRKLLFGGANTVGMIKRGDGRKSPHESGILFTAVCSEC